MTEWWQDYYGEEFLFLMNKSRTIPPEKLKEDCDFIQSCLAESPGNNFLDIGCGLGDYAIEFSRRGYQVTGIDISSPSIEEARKRGKNLESGAQWICEDLRRFSPQEQFDGAFQFFSSFGYCEKLKDNLLILKNIAKALKSGGIYLLELNNIFILANLVSSHCPTRTWMEGDSGVYLLREADFDLPRQRWLLKDTYLLPDGSRKTMESAQYLFTAKEITNHMAQEGLKVLEFYGDIDKSPFTATSPLLYVLAQKE